MDFDDLFDKIAPKLTPPPVDPDHPTRKWYLKYLNSWHTRFSEEDKILLKQVLTEYDLMDVVHVTQALRGWYGAPSPNDAKVLIEYKQLLKYSHKRYPKRVYRGLSGIHRTPENLHNPRHKVTLTDLEAAAVKKAAIVTGSDHGVDACTTSYKKAMEFADGYTYAILRADITHDTRDQILVMPPQYTHMWFNVLMTAHNDEANDYRKDENEVILEGPIPYKVSAPNKATLNEWLTSDD